MVSSDINGPWAVEMEDNSVSLALVRYMSSKEGGLVPAFWESQLIAKCWELVDCLYDKVKSYEEDQWRECVSLKDSFVDVQ